PQEPARTSDVFCLCSKDITKRCCIMPVPGSDQPIDEIGDCFACGGHARVLSVLRPLPSARLQPRRHMIALATVGWSPGEEGVSQVPQASAALSHKQFR